MLPSYYDPTRVGELYTPDVLNAVGAGKSAHLTPASHDQRRVALLLIDMQVDFIHPQGTLNVPGAVADTQRTIEWLYAHSDQITTVAASLDSHLPIQIFSPSWWADAAGNHPAPYTVITHDDVQAGLWIPLYEVVWSQAYVTLLEQQSKKQLMIWPYHTLIGTPGHNLMPALYEAIAYHSSARTTQPTLLNKGDEPRTEHYSIIEPEVKVPANPAQNFNQPFIELLASHDVIYIAGQAKSHCVIESVASLMRYFQGNQQVIRKFRILTDAMSSVQHPSIDFDALANAALAVYAEQGLVLTTTQASLS